MTAHVTLEPAYLLSRRAYQETSLLLEAFTPAHGRVGLVARGVRGGKSKRRGLLQEFAPLLLSWRAGGELGTLQAAESAGASIVLQGERIFHGWYVNELLLRLLPRGDAHPGLFERYAVTLAELTGSEALASDALRHFELGLLIEIGYAPQLPASLQPDRFYRYDAEQGPEALAADEPGAYAGCSLIQLREGQLSDARARRDAQRLLRGLLAAHLGDRPLRTRELLREMRARTSA